MSRRHFEGSAVTSTYATFRPEITGEVIQQIVSHLKLTSPLQLDLAVDVGCGSGQATRHLAAHFQRVVGTDPSEGQITQARQRNEEANVEYLVGAAEELTPFKDNSAQLILASQAAHWFDLPRFFKEVDRVLQPNGCVALLGYLNRLRHPEMEGVRAKFYKKLVDGGYWPPERAIVDNEYRDITLPYTDSTRLSNCIVKEGNLDSYIGYLTSWSGYNYYVKATGDESTLRQVRDETRAHMHSEDETIYLEYPIFILVGRKPCSDK